MPAEYTCPSCGTVLRAARPLSSASRLRCPDCNGIFHPSDHAGGSAGPDSPEPFRISCPSCKAGLRLAHPPAVGQRMRCPKCGVGFVAPDPRSSPLPSPDGERPAGLPPTASSRPARSAPRRSIDRSGEPEEAESAALDEGVRPHDRSEGPRRKKGRLKAKKRKIHGGLVALLIGGSVALLVGGVTLWMVLRPKAADPRVAAFVAANNRMPPRPAPAPAAPVPARGGPVTPPGTRPLLPKGQPAANRFQPTFDGWLQDLEEAKRRAAAEKKDVAIVFFGSDWSSWCIRLAYEVFFQPEFREQCDRDFVLVFVDFPQKEPAKSKVADPARNERLQAHYQVDGFPRLILVDAQGRPFGFTGYKEGGHEAYLDHLRKFRQARERRDRLLDAVGRAEGIAKLEAAKGALDFLEESRLLSYYGPLVEEWSKSAATLDPGNTQGYAEVFFEAYWDFQWDRAQKSKDPAAVSALLRLGFFRVLDGWKKHNRFKDPNRAASLHLLAARLLLMADKKQTERAGGYLKEGLAYRPTDERLTEVLRGDIAALGLVRRRSGTGFVVAADGHILTNSHVVSGKGQLLVRFPGVKETLPAELVAEDRERDIAMIRVKLPKGARLAALRLAGRRDVGRGERVAALGYPLGDAVGSGLKLTAGVVSATPEPGTGDMILLDARVNPGNSGGPLCDNFGHVVGMVTAKSIGGGSIDAYGMALPARDLEEFLKKNLRGYRPAAAAGKSGAKSLEWNDVDRRVSPSVLMVMKAL